MSKVLEKKILDFEPCQYDIVFELFTVTNTEKLSVTLPNFFSKLEIRTLSASSESVLVLLSYVIPKL